MKNVVVLGSTGSIGTQTLSVIAKNPEKFRVLALLAYSSADKLSEQANEFRPEYVGLSDENAVKNLKLNYNAEVHGGSDTAALFASLDKADVVVSAITGMNAFDGVVSAIKHKKTVALASKEVLVSGGEYITALSKSSGSSILPVDSEHSAVWQCLDGKNPDSVDKIILTASGGPFYSVNRAEDLKSITPQQAVRHPNWQMGKKISVDSATMMNK
ncbi:MAG: 1-deoxy-D-xylulose-5-phosphate reductoisomerase, partial [Candidatus Neoclostridium sp.]